MLLVHEDACDIHFLQVGRPGQGEICYGFTVTSIPLACKDHGAATNGSSQNLKTGVMLGALSSIWTPEEWDLEGCVSDAYLFVCQSVFRIHVSEQKCKYAYMKLCRHEYIH